MKKYILLIALAAMTACAPVMHANRPDPVDLSQFANGQTRLSVVSQLGSPTSTIQNKDASCDIYKLYTDGPDSGSKGAIVAGYAIADVLTLGLTEVIFTPVEAATKSDKKTVLFCYGAEDKLVSLSQSDTPSGN